MGAERAFKSKETVESYSDKEEEEKRVCTIKKIKCKHIEELIGMSKGKKAVELQTMVATLPYPNTSHQRLLHHLGQLASQPPYVTSTASAKPWL
ncbi:hypothetical protein C0995_012480, partial [Termitomyces sp. Mi166